MNQLEAEIVHYRVSGQIIICELMTHGTPATAVILDSPSELNWLQEGQKVNILFKETEVMIAKGDIGMLSLNNRFTGKITGVETGDIYSSLMIDFGTGIESVITSKSVRRLELKEGDVVTALVKANEISIGRRD